MWHRTRRNQLPTRSGTAGTHRYSGSSEPASCRLVPDSPRRRAGAETGREAWSVTSPMGCSYPGSTEGYCTAHLVGGRRPDASTQAAFESRRPLCRPPGDPGSPQQPQCLPASGLRMDGEPEVFCLNLLRSKQAPLAGVAPGPGEGSASLFLSTPAWLRAEPWPGPAGLRGASDTAFREWGQGSPTVVLLALEADL